MGCDTKLKLMCSRTSLVISQIIDVTLCGSSLFLGLLMLWMQFSYISPDKTLSFTSGTSERVTTHFVEEKFDFLGPPSTPTGRDRITYHPNRGNSSEKSTTEPSSSKAHLPPASSHTFITDVSATTERTNPYDDETGTDSDIKEPNATVESTSDGPILHIPPDVQDLQISNVTEHSIMLSWTEDTRYLHGYCLLFRETKSPNYTKELPKPPKCDCDVTLNSSETFSFENLQRFTEYTVGIAKKMGNTCGKVKKMDVVTKKGLPPAPINVNVTRIKQRSIRISWEIPTDSNSRVLDGFELTIRPLNAGDARPYTLGSDRRSHSIVNLTPGTKIEIQMCGFNNEVVYNGSARLENGTHQAICSERLQVTTNPLEPGKVVHLTAEEIDGRSVRLKWKQPIVKNGPIHGYIISYIDTLKQIREYETKGNHSTEYEYCVRKLTPMTNYTFNVWAYNWKTVAKESKLNGSAESVSINTGPAAPDRPIINVTRTRSTFKDITLFWEYPYEYPGKMSFTVMVYRSPNENQPCQGKAALSFKNVTVDVTTVDKLLPPSKRMANITGLSPYMEYGFCVEAKTRRGTNVSEPMFRIRTQAKKPETPRELSVTEKKSRQLQVEWKKQDEYPGPTNYTVLAKVYTIGQICACPTHDVQNVMENVASVVELRGWNQSDALLENLTPFTDYCIIVIAKTDGGFNCNYTSSLTCPDKPSSPEKFSAVAINATSILLTWEAPLEKNGRIDGYSVTCLECKGQSNSSDAVNVEALKTVFGHLKPYTNYTFRILAYNSDECIQGTPKRLKSDSVETMARTKIAVPNAPENVEISNISFNCITISWEAPDPMPGPTSYTVFVRNAKENVCQMNEILRNVTEGLDNWSNTEATIDNLSPYTEYCVQIKAETEAGYSVSNVSKIVKTEPGIPEMPKLQLGSENIQALVVNLQWETPEKFVGPTNYTVYVERNPEECECPPKDAPDSKTESGVVIERITGWNNTQISLNVLPFTEYCVAVLASTGKQRTACGNYSRTKIKTAPYMPGAPKELKVYCSSESNTASLVWNPPDVTNGILETYRIQYGKFKNISKNFTQVFENTSIVISGNGDVKGVVWQFNCSLSLCSGSIENLDHDSYYMFEVRGGTKDVPEFGEEIRNYDCYFPARPVSPEERNSNAGTIVASVLALIVLVAAAIFGYVQRETIRKYIRNTLNKPFPPITPPLEIIDMPNQGRIRPVRVSEFWKHVANMLSDSSLKFSEEYEELRSVKFNYTTIAALLPENRPKNRWTNILPYDQSRVKLLPIDDDPGSDYINASYVPGFNSPREYIATQGPLPGTVDDFWRMIWEQGVKMIVMLTQCVERGKKKCEQYWNSDNEMHCYGDLQIRMRSESVLSGYTIRIFDVQLGDRQRVVKQMHFTKWPDFGSPETPQMLLNFVRAVRDHVPHTNVGPIVVHCSAGVGRTGTFIAVDRLMRHIIDHEYIDVYTTVLEMRQYRPNMVQTEDQYIYIHLCMRDLIEERKMRLSSNSSDEATYANTSFEMDPLAD